MSIERESMFVWLKDEKTYGIEVERHAHFSKIEYLWHGHTVQEVFLTEDFVGIEDLIDEYRFGLCVETDDLPKMISLHDSATAAENAAVDNNHFTIYIDL